MFLLKVIPNHKFESSKFLEQIQVNNSFETDIIIKEESGTVIDKTNTSDTSNTDNDSQPSENISEPVPQPINPFLNQNLRKFFCSKQSCGARFDTPELCMEHMEICLQHANKCEFCTMSFKKSSDLEKHRRLHLGEVRNSIQASN